MREDELSARLQSADVVEPVGVLPSGTILGDWRLTAFIARGGSADVYCAVHVILGTAAAVKVLRDGDKESRRVRFRREAKLLSELKSASFPRFHAYGTSDGCDYLVEELLEPRELPQGNRAGVRFLCALCDAVGELHAHGLVHCDIKPANILFRPESGEPVLVDLGLAASAAESTEGGTPGYSAPEQFLGGEVTPATDIHALGVLAERMQLSYRGVIRRATSSIPSERYKSVAEFTQAIRRRRRGFWLALGLLTLGALYLLVVAANWIKNQALDEIHLNGQTIVRTEPLRIGDGKTLRIIGPGTFDAEISGGKGSQLWMTNCLVINRAKRIYPADLLYYELTHGVYLNFINADRPSMHGHRRCDYFNLFDGAYNEVRYRGPATLKEMQELRAREYRKLLSLEEDPDNILDCIQW